MDDWRGRWGRGWGRCVRLRQGEGVSGGCEGGGGGCVGTFVGSHLQGSCVKDGGEMWRRCRVWSCLLQAARKMRVSQGSADLIRSWRRSPREYPWWKTGSECLNLGRTGGGACGPRTACTPPQFNARWSRDILEAFNKYNCLSPEEE